MSGKKNGDSYSLEHTAKQRRLAARRREENTEAFRERYRVRGGIEGTNSDLKRRTGLGQLRVRGAPAVFHAIYLKIAAACAKIRQIVHEKAAAAALCLHFAILSLQMRPQSGKVNAKNQSLRYVRQIENFSTLNRKQETPQKRKS